MNRYRPFDYAAIEKTGLKIALLFSICLISCDVEIQLSDMELKHKETQKKESMQYVETFKIEHCEKITIRYYNKMSDSNDGIPPKSKDITDVETIYQLLSLINKLPDKGEIMIKMGNVSVLQVLLTINETETVFFSFYGSGIKTTDTTFYSKHPVEEKKIYDMLMSFFK